MEITDDEKRKMIEKLLEAGAIKRESLFEYKDGSIGKKGLPILKIKI